VPEMPETAFRISEGRHVPQLREAILRWMELTRPADHEWMGAEHRDAWVDLAFALAEYDSALEDSLDALFDEIADWTAATFPAQTPASAVRHAKREIDNELMANPTSGEEQADVVMLMIAAARTSRNDLKAELRRKLAINRQRQWGEPDADGVQEHIR